MQSSSEGRIAARLDRLPFSRSLWKLVLLISLGGAFELYDIFLSTYITPGLVASGLFTTSAPGFFSINSVGFFISCNFAGMFLGCVGFGYVADRLGRRSIFIFSLLWYSICTATMAFQTTAASVDLWRFIAGIGVGLEQVTIDTFLPEIVPPQGRGKAFAFYQFVEFCAVPVVALFGWLLVRRQVYGLDGWRVVTLIGSFGRDCGVVAAAGHSRESALAGRAWARGRSGAGDGGSGSSRGSRYRRAAAGAGSRGRGAPRAKAPSARFYSRPTSSAPWCSPSSI